ncbi:Manganese/iron superoxide dismutase [Suillus placidus]|uniref:Superoxide dismutase n=1 Tax=Suillus placidus TaxID=48579 RepID=A0A9P6ZXD8_9AGAM|nr:Manganese/iron superoxide dismutase [Suillus placidus]
MLSIAKATLRPSLARAFAAPATSMSLHTLPDLPYAYNALEPYISEAIMKLHHSKHHQAYVNGLNTAEQSYAKSPSVREKIALQSALKFNGGGHINHSLFWKNLSPTSADGGNLPDGPLKKAIERDFGSVEEFKKKFNAATVAIQGSGWGWLVRHFTDFMINIADVGLRRATTLPPKCLRSLRPPTKILYFVRVRRSLTGYLLTYLRSSYTHHRC